MSDPRPGPSPSRPSFGSGEKKLTPAQFVEAVVNSRLVGRVRLAAVLDALSPEVAKSARKTADHLVAGGDLTRYQADKLLQGVSDGLVLGPYRVLSPLGRGGMASVYLARDDRERVPTLVALKVLPPSKAKAERAALARFLREIDLGRQLDHTHIARTFDAGYAGGVHYIAMEFVQGVTLRKVVERDGPMGVEAAARVMADVADGLQHAHERGLIHRDLKPSNVMVTPDGRGKLLDLGLAILEDEDRPDDPTVLGGRGYILGTMDYIAPEQAVDATAVGPRSDLYGLGCTGYFAVTGLPPFPGGTSKQKLKWHRTVEPPPADQLNAGVPYEFARLLERLMAKKPEDRPESGAAVCELLRPWTGEVAVEVEVVPVVTAVRVADETADDEPSAERERGETGEGLGLGLAAALVMAAVAGLAVVVTLARRL